MFLKQLNYFHYLDSYLSHNHLCEGMFIWNERVFLSFYKSRKGYATPAQIPDHTCEDHGYLLRMLM